MTAYSNLSVIVFLFQFGLRQPSFCDNPSGVVFTEFRYADGCAKAGQTTQRYMEPAEGLEPPAH